MCKVFACFVLCLIAIAAKAQPAVPKYEAYGKVDKEDLEMKECDFEKDANAEVLFDKGVADGNSFERHVRIKIFNEAGFIQANIRLLGGVRDLKAETINSDGGKINVTPVDAKQVYSQQINAFLPSVTFSFPNVKPGSIIEYKCTTYTPGTWFFQTDIPTRYSEIDAKFTTQYPFKFISHVRQPFFKSVGEPFDIYQDKVLTNVSSLSHEPYMGVVKDNLQRMEYIGHLPGVYSWAEFGNLLIRYDKFGDQTGHDLDEENAIIDQARSLKSTDEKIAFIFNLVKNDMKWNNVTTFVAVDGTPRAWSKKIGNSAEINFILCHLLKKTGIPAYPLVICSKENGKLNPFNPNIFSVNNTVVYISADTANTDSAKYYVLDATNKYNLFNEIPKDNLNTFGLLVSDRLNKSKTVFIQNTEPAMQSVFINAEITPQGKMNGTAELSSYSYNKISNITHYKTDDEAKFINYLTDNDNNLKILSLKTENADIDTLPFVQNMNFSLDLTGTDNSYIYFSPNLFVTPHKNPFISQTRSLDIDFGYLDNTSINGTFKIPAGYKIEAIPSNTVMIMPDTSIIFRRSVNEDQGAISIRYVISRKKTLYSPNDYPDLYAFYKKMYEMLDEQIVLKKD
jgi:hypothetical protein